MINLDEYIKIEGDEISKVGFLVSEVFSNAYFARNNRIAYETEQKSMWKYIDSHHDKRLNKIIDVLLGSRITEHEFELLNKLFEKFRNFSKQNNLPFSIKNASIFRALFQKRVIESLIGNKNNLNIIEIGPGSGWLSSLLYIDNYNVFSIENTQSHYCFQSKLFSSIAKNKFRELAKRNHTNYSNLNHLPWWKICKPNFAMPKQDLITSNHMIQECSVWAVHFYISMVNRVLKDDGIWVIEGTGAGYIGGPTLEFLKEETKKHGFNFYDISGKFPTNDGIYVLSKNKIELNKQYKPIDINLDYFSKKFHEIKIDGLLSSGEFLEFANIPH
jgi:hypothetical protein